MKCSRRHGFCAGIVKILDFESRKGVSAVNTMNLKTGKERLIGVRWRDSHYKHGIMLNYCPFCGGSLQWWPKQRKGAAA